MCFFRIFSGPAGLSSRITWTAPLLALCVLLGYWAKSGLAEEAAQVPIVLNKVTLIVTQPTEQYDTNKSAQRGTNILVQEFKTNEMPVMYLASDTNPETADVYTEDRRPTYKIKSAAGELPDGITLVSPEYVLAGGFFQGGQSTTVRSLIKNYFKDNSHQDLPLQIHLPMSATYTYKGKEGQAPDPLVRHLASSGVPGFVEYVREYFGPNGEIGGTKDARPKSLTEINTNNFRFEVYLDGKMIHVVGTKGPLIQMRFWRPGKFELRQIMAVEAIRTAAELPGARSPAMDDERKCFQNR